MARARGGGGTTGYAVATVLFAILFVFSLIMAIVFYTQLGKAQQGTDRAQRDLRKFISPQEERQQQLVVLQNRATDQRKTVYKMLSEDVFDLKRIIGGSDSEPVRGLREDGEVEGGGGLVGQWKQLVGDSGNAYVIELQRLKAELKAQQDTISELKSGVSTARESVEEVQSAKIVLAREFEVAKRADEQQRTQIRAEFGEQVTAFNATVSSVEQDMTSKLDETRTASDQYRTQVEVRQALIRDLKSRNRDLEDLVANREKNKQPQVMTPDGQIESFLVDEQLVFIDLGRVHHVQPGMAFEVFGRSDPVKLDNADQLSRGKATIEVIEVSQYSATARVVRLARGRQVQERDRIYNVVFDKDLKPVFFVFGEFDVHRTGRASRADGRRIKQMVEQYRGELAAELNYQVDYLVLGVEPDVPSRPDKDEIDPAVLKRHHDAKERYEAYQALIDQARGLEIPILNQNRFLALVGHYRG